ncbi:RHS repeat-associated core domain-containing protein, partial [Gelidibacter japonicus]|uniref:RHS repeat-associated core domain-containing protein n=1 Tax=Gelidibacter japonicus TaxID=1962232 RepID=UPI002AFDF954
DNVSIQRVHDVDILEENNYYPFGLEHKGYNSNVSANINSVAKKFKYNGIEFEESLGLDLYEMEFRNYDPAIARFTSIDPVTHHSNSTYTALDNNPVIFADPSGADSETLFKSKFLNKDGGHWSDLYRNGNNDSPVNAGYDEFNSYSNQRNITYGDSQSQLSSSSGDISNVDEDNPDPPKYSFKWWIQKLFQRTVTSEEDYQDVQFVRSTSTKAFEKATEVGAMHLQVTATIATLPLGGEGGALFKVTSSTTRNATVEIAGSANSFYKILNPAWDGTFNYTLRNFSTTGFTTANGTKVLYNTTSNSTAMPSIKLITKEGYHLFLRFKTY